MKLSRGAVLLALALDLMGEPPPPFHPVIWMGNFLKAAQGCWRAETTSDQLWEGAAWWALGAVASAGAGALGQRLPGGWVTQGVLLKPLLARRALFAAVDEVHAALAADNLPEARLLLAWHLVSRETAGLTASEVAGAAIESLAENLSDSVAAPLLWFRVGGLPLAALYRYANTADAMWGYRTPELEYAGKVAAHADDALNLAPARLTAICIVLAAGGRGLNIWARDRRHTASPNAGHPMSAFAGALGLRLDKRGVYVLNANGRVPEAADLPRALTLARRTFALTTIVLLLPWKTHA